MAWTAGAIRLKGKRARKRATHDHGYPLLPESATVAPLSGAKGHVRIRVADKVIDARLHRGAIGKFILRSILLALTAMTTATAHEEPSRLRYTVPEGWTPSIDGISLLPPGGNAVVTFTPSTPFAGTAEQWSEEAWSSIARELKVLSGPAPGTQGPFLSRIGLFQKADGSTFWLCLNTLLKDGRGESVILVAGGDDQFRAQLPALSKMLAGATVAASSVPAAAAPGLSTRSAPGATVAGGDEIAGLYLASTSQYRMNPLGGPGSGSWEWRTEFYLLSRDGRVFRGPDLPNAPNGDISRFDYDAARREAPSASGTWTARGRDVVLKMGVPPQETIVATRPETGVLEIRGTKYKRGVANRPPK
jgi:hypothetical protein